VIIRMGLSHVKSVAKSIIGLLFVQELTLQGYGKVIINILLIINIFIVVRASHASPVSDLIILMTKH